MLESGNISFFSLLYEVSPIFANIFYCFVIVFLLCILVACFLLMFCFISLYSKSHSDRDNSSSDDCK